MKGESGKNGFWNKLTDCQNTFNPNERIVVVVDVNTEEKELLFWELP